MIVVADTSVILNLCRIQHEHLLQKIFRRVIIPTQVAEVFTRLTKTEKRFSDLILPRWLEVLPAPKLIPDEVFQAQLDVGESAAIALCLSQKADALLIDELAGRKVAAKLGVRTIGIVGILVDSKNEKLISSVKSLLNRLEGEANFWLATDLRNRALHMAGE